MNKKRMVCVVVILAALALGWFLFDQFRWVPLQQVLEAHQWSELESARAYGEAGQGYAVDLTLEQVKAAVTGRLARKGDRANTVPAPAVWCIIRTEDGRRIEYAFSNEGLVLINSKFNSRPCPAWKTDGTVYEALMG